MTSESSYDSHYRAGGFGYEERRDFWRDWVTRNYVQEFDLAAGMTLLDACCGDGFWSSLFHEHGLQVSGFDISAGGIATARSAYPGPRFEVGDLDGTIPFADEKFDVVFARNISHFLRELDTPAQRAAERLASLVADGGLLLVSQFSRRTGLPEGSAISHAVSTYALLLEQVGALVKYTLADNHLLFGVRPRMDAVAQPAR